MHATTIGRAIVAGKLLKLHRHIVAHKLGHLFIRKHAVIVGKQGVEKELETRLASPLLHLVDNVGNVGVDGAEVDFMTRGSYALVAFAVILASNDKQLVQDVVHGVVGKVGNEAAINHGIGAPIIGGAVLGNLLRRRAQVRRVDPTHDWSLGLGHNGLHCRHVQLLGALLDQLNGVSPHLGVGHAFAHGRGGGLNRSRCGPERSLGRGNAVANGAVQIKRCSHGTEVVLLKPETRSILLCGIALSQAWGALNNNCIGQGQAALVLAVKLGPSPGGHHGGKRAPRVGHCGFKRAFGGFHFRASALPSRRRRGQG